MRAFPPWLLLLSCAACGGAVPNANAQAWDGAVQAYGSLRAMMHDGQIGPAVGLDTVLPSPDLYAVGALAELAGEITIFGGKAFLAYPDGQATRTEIRTRAQHGAALLVTASVPAWQSVVTERPIRFEDLDEEIAKLAVEAGMNLDRRFPFLLEGEFENLQWHVIDGRRLTAGGTSHRDHQAAAVKIKLDRAEATLVGFYSRNDQGVFTHLGSATHIHCVRDEPLGAGHVDHVVVPAGTTVKFPR